MSDFAVEKCQCAGWAKGEETFPITPHHPECPNYDPVGHLMRVVNRARGKSETSIWSSEIKVHSGVVGGMKRLSEWWKQNVFFVSWHKYWKGIYWHIFPRYCVRTYLWGIDWHLKQPLYGRRSAENRKARKMQKLMEDQLKAAKAAK